MPSAWSSFLSFFLTSSLVLNGNGLVNAFIVSPSNVVSLESTTTRLHAASSPLAEEALECFPFTFGPETGSGRNAKTSGSAERRLITQIPKSQALMTFNELARLYGDDRALKIVKTQPTCLLFKADNFQECFEIWTDMYGEESTKDMVSRNPGLLGIKPEKAADNKEATMAFSYIIGITRPLPQLALGAILILLVTGGFKF